jgi:hypothetical protein
MHGAYNIDSDDEEEEKPLQSNIPKSANVHIQELQKVLPTLDTVTPHLTPFLIIALMLMTFFKNQLKDKTAELLDATWKEQRNRQLLSKMLELEEPTITTKVKCFCCRLVFEDTPISWLYTRLRSLV